jgi:serine/threonine-protein kinase
VVLSLGPPVKVPDVIGQSEDQAVETLEKAGLSPKVIRKHNPATEGKVFGTDVNLGQEICPDKPVTIWVSKGPIPPPVNEVPVPNVVGEAANDARIRLERARFGYRVGASEFSERVPEGHVISQNPRGGLKRRPGIIVSVTLSLGRRIVLPTRKVPSVLGMSEQEARSTIELAGFKYGRSRSEFDDEPKGTAIGQSPAPGALRPLATAVRIVLSRGRKPEPRPEPCRLRCELPRVGPECDKLFCSERERKDHYVVVHGLP